MNRRTPSFRRLPAILAGTVLALTTALPGGMAVPAAHAGLIGGLIGDVGGLLKSVVNIVLVTVPILPGPRSDSETINGAVGGTVQAGRFTLVVPPGAFSGLAKVSIDIPDPGALGVNLSISPASANNFRVPVTLISDARGGSYRNVRMLQTMWYDELAGTWREVPGSQVNATTGRVIAPLVHFSKYGVTEGKAGW